MQAKKNRFFEFQQTLIYISNYFNSGNNNVSLNSRRFFKINKWELVDKLENNVQ